MSDIPTIGEIRYMEAASPPDGWLLCDGSLLLIHQYEALFAVIGWDYGGIMDNDREKATFGLPNLMRSPDVRPGVIPVIARHGIFPQRS